MIKNIKPFLFPTLKKVLIAAFLFYSFGWIIYPSIITSLITDWQPSGFPLAIYAFGFAGVYMDISSAVFAFIIDVIFWYLVSAILIKANVGFWRFLLYFVFSIFSLWIFCFLWFSFG